MSRTISPSSNRPYGVVMVSKEWGFARSTFYAAKRQPEQARQRRGPKPQIADAELSERIRQVLGERFFGEGYRKAWARLRMSGVRVSQRRVLRVMREAGLLAPVKARRVLGPRNHDGRITTDRPDEMWGTDLTTVMTLEEGQAAVFIGVDHCTTECVGVHAAKQANRFEALEPVRQGIRDRFGAYAEGVAPGLSIRHDHGSQYVSGAFQGELSFLGIQSSPAFVRAPEGNGCAERFIRTLKEQLLWVKTFRTVEELRLALHQWVERYNREWLVAKHGYRTPAQVRKDLTTKAMAA